MHLKSFSKLLNYFHSGRSLPTLSSVILPSIAKFAVLAIVGKCESVFLLWDDSVYKPQTVSIDIESFVLCPQGLMENYKQLESLLFQRAEVS